MCAAKTEGHILLQSLTNLLWHGHSVSKLVVQCREFEIENIQE
jgi:hypothetical protein